MNTYKKFAAAAVIAIIGSSASAASVVNGSFEDIGSGSFNGGGWNQFGSIPGWTGSPNLEIQSNPTLSSIDAQDGSNYAELDTNQNATLSQDIVFAIGKYALSFYYSPRVDAAPTNTNDMSYSLSMGMTEAAGGSILGAPTAAYPWGEWKKVTNVFNVDTAGSYTLSFTALGNSFQQGCGNCGALIDNVSVAAVPLPASVLFLLAGVGGLGAMRKRNQKA